MSVPGAISLSRVRWEGSPHEGKSRALRAVVPPFGWWSKGESLATARGVSGCEEASSLSRGVA